MAALEYLDSLRTAHPDLCDWCDTLAHLYQTKLWHQLTLKLEEFVQLSPVQAGDGLIQLYHNFITNVETNINLLKLAHFAVMVSHQYSEAEASISYLEGVIERVRATKGTRVDEPILYIKMQIAFLKWSKGYQKQCKNLLEDGKSTLDGMTDVDPSVYAKYYWVSFLYHDYRREFSECYTSGLLYLAHTSVESLSDSLKLELAYSLCRSALMADNIYDFGELLEHPILSISLHHLT